MVALEKETGLPNNPLQVKFTEQACNLTTSAPTPAAVSICSHNYNSQIKFNSVACYMVLSITRYGISYIKKNGITKTEMNHIYWYSLLEFI